VINWIHVRCYPPVGNAVWELLTGERPFQGLLEGDLVVGVCDRKLRPLFPPGAPAAYIALAQQCWADDASERPTAALVRAIHSALHMQERTDVNGAQSSCGQVKCGGSAY
jgi:hypothetical protein